MKRCILQPLLHCIKCGECTAAKDRRKNTDEEVREVVENLKPIKKLGINTREKDILELANQVIEMSLIKYYNSCGSDEFTCPLCDVSIKIRGKEKEPYAATFPHALSCGYLIAKDLLTRME